MTDLAAVDEYAARLPDGLREVFVTTRTIVDAAFEDGSLAVRWAHPTWSLGKDPVCYLKKAGASHLTFGFWRGASLDDPSGRLETSGSVMAHVKLRSISDVDRSLFADWVRQARTLTGPCRNPAT